MRNYKGTEKPAQDGPERVLKLLAITLGAQARFTAQENVATARAKIEIAPAAPPQDALSPAFRDGALFVSVRMRPNARSRLSSVRCLVMAAADMATNAQRKLGADMPAPAALRVKRWSITPKHDARLFTFVTDHFEIHLEVTPETVREDEASSANPKS
jgi:hypothetical protein